MRAQNVRGSLDHDLMSVVDRFGGPFTPVGFYYRTMIRPRRAWPLYEKVLRNLAGLGRVGGASHRRYDTEHRSVDVLVIGGGGAGRRAAGEAAATGASVLLVDEGHPFNGRGYDVLAPARALADLRGRARPRRRGRRPLPRPCRSDRRRDRRPRAAARLPGQRPRRRDAPGRGAPAGRRMGDPPGDARGRRRRCRRSCRLPRARRRRDRRGRRSAAEQLSASRAPRARSARSRLDGRRIDCDLLVASGAQPARVLAALAGRRACRVRAAARRLRPGRSPPGVEVVGGAAGAGRQQPVAAGLRRRRRQVLRLRLRGRDGRRT